MGGVSTTRTKVEWPVRWLSAPGSSLRFLYGLSSLGTGHTAAYFSFSGCVELGALIEIRSISSAAALPGSRA
jgi:hypothetical protein